MGDPQIIASAVVAVVLAIAGATVTVINAVYGAKRQLLEASKEIHTLVNSTATAQVGRIASLETIIQGLQATIATLQDKRVLDAQAKTT